MRNIFFIFFLFFSSLFLSACNPLDSKVKSGLQVMVTDSPSSLFLDDQYLDKAPYVNKQIKPGRYVLKIVPEDSDYPAYETIVNLHKGLLTVVTWTPGKTPETSGGIIYEMEPINNKDRSEVSFITVPDSTIINFDNQEPHHAPIIFQDLEPGHHEFEIKLPSYTTQKHTINILAGHRLIIYAKLAKSSQDPTTNQPRTPASNSLNTQEASPAGQLIPEVTITTLTASEDAKIESQNQNISGTRVKILPTNFFQNSVEVLKIRNSANQSGAEIGFAQVKREYKYIEKSDNNWYKIEFEDGKEGWVSGQYAELVAESLE